MHKIKNAIQLNGIFYLEVPSPKKKGVFLSKNAFQDI